MSEKASPEIPPHPAQLDRSEEAILRGDVFRRTALSFGLRIAGAGIGFAFNILVARSLGIDEAGLFFLAMAVLSILPVLARVGTDTAAARFGAIAHHQNNASAIRGIAASSMGVTIGGSIFFSVILWVAAPYLGADVFDSTEIIPVLKLAALAILPIALQKVISDLLLVSEKIWISQFVQMLLPQLANFLFFLWMIQLGTVTQGMLAIVLAAYFTAVIAILFWIRVPQHRRGTVSMPDSGAFFRGAWGAAGVAAAGLGISALSPVLLGVYGTKENVAIFAVALRVAMLSNFIAFAVQNATLRKFSILFANSGTKEKLEMEVQSATRLSAILHTLLLLPCVIFAKPIMGIFGHHYEAEAWVLVLLAGGQLLIGILGPVTPLLLMSGHEKSVRNYTIVAATVNAILLIAIVPDFGAKGAAIAFSATYLGSALMQAMLIRRVMGFWMFMWKRHG